MIETRTRLDEILIRVGLDEQGNRTYAGHQVSIREVLEDGVLQSARLQDPQPLDLADVVAVLGPELPHAIAERDAALAGKAQAETAHAAEKAQLEQAHAEALAAQAAALAEAHAADLAEALAARDPAARQQAEAYEAAIGQLEAQIAALTAPSPVRKVLNYRFKLALDQLGLLDAANAMVTFSDPAVGLYWGGGIYGAGAPEFYIDDPLLVEMAGALVQQLGLAVTLEEVFDLADTFR